MMQQLLHTIAQEFQIFKQKSQSIEVNKPTLNGKSFSDGFNLFWASLWANNHSLTGNFSTLDFINKNDLKIKENAPRITLLDYYFTNSLLFLEENIKNHISNFEMNDENLKKLQKIFEEGEIKSFPTEKRQEIQKYLGKTYEINFGKSILNYKRIEAVPNEFIQNLTLSNAEILSEKPLKIRENGSENFDESLQNFYFSLENFGKANMKTFQKFELHELNLDTDFLVRTQNNFILSKQIEIKLFNQIKKI